MTNELLEHDFTARKLTRVTTFLLAAAAVLTAGPVLKTRADDPLPAAVEKIVSIRRDKLNELRERAKRGTPAEKAAVRNEIRILESGEFPDIRLNLSSLTVGDVGRMPDNAVFEINHVLESEKSAIVYATLSFGTGRRKSAGPMIFRGPELSGKASGARVNIDRNLAFVVSGTEKDIYVIEPIDLKKWQPAIKERLKAGK